MIYKINNGTINFSYINLIREKTFLDFSSSLDVDKSFRSENYNYFRIKRNPDNLQFIFEFLEYLKKRRAPFLVRFIFHNGVIVESYENGFGTSFPDMNTLYITVDNGQVIDSNGSRRIKDTISISDFECVEIMITKALSAFLKAFDSRDITCKSIIPIKSYFDGSRLFIHFKFDEWDIFSVYLDEFKRICEFAKNLDHAVLKFALRDRELPILDITEITAENGLLKIRTNSNSIELTYSEILSSKFYICISFNTLKA